MDERPKPTFFFSLSNHNEPQDLVHLKADFEAAQKKHGKLTLAIETPLSMYEHYAINRSDPAKLRWLAGEYDKNPNAERFWAPFFRFLANAAENGHKIVALEPLKESRLARIKQLPDDDEQGKAALILFLRGHPNESIAYMRKAITSKLVLNRIRNQIRTEILSGLARKGGNVLVWQGFNHSLEARKTAGMLVQKFGAQARVRNHGEGINLASSLIIRKMAKPGIKISNDEVLRAVFAEYIGNSLTILGNGELGIKAAQRMARVASIAQIREISRGLGERNMDALYSLQDRLPKSLRLIPKN
ncbi:MAG: hypothetical protein AABX01_02525 [Candidatus Micrarchaeota archaeon]